MSRITCSRLLVMEGESVLGSLVRAAPHNPPVWTDMMTPLSGDWRAVADGPGQWQLQSAQSISFSGWEWPLLPVEHCCGSQFFCALGVHRQLCETTCTQSTARFDSEVMKSNIFHPWHYDSVNKPETKFICGLKISFPQSMSTKKSCHQMRNENDLTISQGFSRLSRT